MKRCPQCFVTPASTVEEGVRMAFSGMGKMRLCSQFRAALT